MDQNQIDDIMIRLGYKEEVTLTRDEVIELLDHYTGGKNGEEGGEG